MNEGLRGDIHKGKVIKIQKFHLRDDCTGGGTPKGQKDWG